MPRMFAALKMMGQPDADYKEAVVRRLVSPDNLTVSQGGLAYAGYGGNADFTLDNSVNRLASQDGTALGSLAAYPAFDAMRQALPMLLTRQAMRHTAISGFPRRILIHWPLAWPTSSYRSAAWPVRSSLTTHCVTNGGGYC